MFHLVEIRYRTTYLVGSAVGSVLLAFYYSDEFLFLWIKPLLLIPSVKGHHMIWTEMGEAFQTTMDLSCLMTCLCMVPLIAYQGWAFLIPSTYQYERQMMTPILGWALCGMMISLIVSYLILLPAIWTFLFQFQSQPLSVPIEFEARILQYIRFTSSILGALLVVMLCPLYTHVGLEFGWITHQWLCSLRIYAFFLTLLIAACISPPDISSQLAISCGLAILYEMSLFYTYVYAYRKQTQSSFPRKHHST